MIQSSWQTVGAQQFPEAPQTVDRTAYDRTITSEHAVYTTTGADPVTIVVPTGERVC